MSCPQWWKRSANLTWLEGRYETMSHVTWYNYLLLIVPSHQLSNVFLIFNFVLQASKYTVELKSRRNAAWTGQVYHHAIHALHTTHCQYYRSFYADQRSYAHDRLDPRLWVAPHQMKPHCLAWYAKRKRPEDLKIQDCTKKAAYI